MRLNLDKLNGGEALRIINELAAELDVPVYLVGGSVRDILLQRRVNDLDFALGGAHTRLPRLFAERIGGSFFWLDEARLQARVVKKGAAKTHTFDFAPLRGEGIGDDLCQRDFTINAMAVQLGREERVLLDPLAGLADLKARLVRVCHDKSFSDDPLRLLRALRFAATLGFTIEEVTWDSITCNAPLLQQMAAERVREELFLILAAPGIGGALHRLRDSGLMAQVFPCVLLPEMSPSAYGDHIRCAERVEEIGGTLPAIFPREHEQLGRYLADEVEAGITVLSLLKLAAFLCGVLTPGAAALVGERLRLGRKACRLLECLLDCVRIMSETPGERLTTRAQYRFFKDHEPAGPGLIVLALAGEAAPRQLCGRLLSFYCNEYEAVRDELLLSGQEIMHILGVGPGPGVGHAMERLREAERAGLVNDKSEARRFLEKNLLTSGAILG